MMQNEPTLHRRIVEDIEARILSGAWAPGYRIPFETELAASYGCSRMTVNKALTRLARAGLVARKKRSGTYVLQPRAQAAVLEIHDIATEVKSLKQPYGFAVLGRQRRKVGPEDSLRLEDVRAGAPILAVTCMHFAAGQPFCLEDRLINLANVPEADAADFSTLPPGTWLLAQVPWSSAQHRIQAMGAPQEVAAALHIAIGAACLVVERRTWSSAGSVTHVRLTYPGDRHALVATFAPHS